SMAEATGQTVINSEAVGKEVDARRDAPKTIRGDAVISFTGGFFGLPLMVTSGENIGIVRVTGVRSRYVTVAAGVILVLIGFLAPVSRLVNAVPSAVVGGTAVLVFGVIVVLGVQMLGRAALDDHTTTFICAVAIALRLLPILVPGLYASLPPNARILMESGVAVSALTAALLNVLFRGPGGTPGPASAPAGPQTEKTGPDTPTENPRPRAQKSPMHRTAPARLGTEPLLLPPDLLLPPVGPVRGTRALLHGPRSATRAAPRPPADARLRRRPPPPHPVLRLLPRIRRTLGDLPPGLGTPGALPRRRGRLPRSQARRAALAARRLHRGRRGRHPLPGRGRPGGRRRPRGRAAGGARLRRQRRRRHPRRPRRGPGRRREAPRPLRRRRP